MREILARCGYRRDLCLAHRPNVDENPANQQVLSDVWHRVFGFRIEAEDIICDGCMAENARLIDKDCPVRPCVIVKGIASSRSTAMLPGLSKSIVHRMRNNCWSAAR